MLLLEHLFLTLNIYLHALLQVFTFGFYMTYIVFTFLNQIIFSHGIMYSLKKISNKNYQSTYHNLKQSFLERLLREWNANANMV